MPGIVEDDALTVSLRPPEVFEQEPLVEAKLAAPYLRPAVVERDGLLAQLLLTDAGLVTMVAPPGYGKSTSLALWRAKEQRPVGWVTCDAADADPIRFLSYLGFAIDRALALDGPVFAGLSLHPGSALSNAVPRLTSLLHEARQPMVLMLDDVHHLAGTPTVDVLAMIVDYLPRGVTVAVAGRTDAGLPVARLRASGRMLEIGIEELALDEREAGLLAALDGRELQPHEARELHARTEGWPAAVYLAARRVNRVPGGASKAAHRVSGRDTDIADYLDAELLDHATPHVRDFLLRTAVLDRMSPDLCDAVVDGTGSDRILRDLASTNQLVVPLDTHGGWFRYHTLLREHLLARLERDRGAAETVHRRAAEWFAASGMPDLAVDHLFAAGDADAAAAQACAVIPQLFREGREVTFARWLQRLDDAHLRRQPFLAAMGAWMHTIQGRTAEAEHLVDVTDGAEYLRRPSARCRRLRGGPVIGPRPARPGGDRRGDPRRAGRRRAERAPQQLAPSDPRRPGRDPQRRGPARRGRGVPRGCCQLGPGPWGRPGAGVRGCLAGAGRHRARGLDVGRHAVAAHERGRVTDALRPRRGRRRPLGRRRPGRRAPLRAGGGSTSDGDLPGRAGGPRSGDLVDQRPLPHRRRARPPRAGRPGRGPLLPPAGERHPGAAARPGAAGHRGGRAVASGSGPSRRDRAARPRSPRPRCACCACCRPTSRRRRWPSGCS